MGKKFELRIDHSGLKYLFEQQTLNSMQTRWMEFLSEYEFDIKHIIGMKNKVVDALGRTIHALHATTINMCELDLKNRILEALILDEHYLYVKE
jgi:hypothetical protein